jgi:hypothetical protein
MNVPALNRLSHITPRIVLLKKESEFKKNLFELYQRRKNIYDNQPCKIRPSGMNEFRFDIPIPNMLMIITG